MNSSPWYKRYGSDFIAGTLGMTLEEKGAYSIVLDLIYDRDGSIPDDARFIAGVCGCSVRKWNTIRDRLIELGKIHCTDGIISNSRADKEIEKRRKVARKVAENGAKGGNKTAENRTNDNKNNDLDQALLDQHQKPEAREEKEPTNVGSKKRGTRLPESWTLPDDWRAFAEAEGVPRDLISPMADKFRDYWLARAGPQGVKLDWLATWRNWVRNDLERRNDWKKSGGSGARREANDRHLDALAMAARAVGGR